MSHGRALMMVCLAGLATAAPAQAGTIVVRAGGNLQAAIDAAQPGDTILLEAGATFRGNFTLPVKSGAAYITIRSSAADASLPRPGTRISPAWAHLLPKIESTNAAAAMRTLAGAHHWRLQLLEFPATYLGYGEILRFGEGTSAQTQLSQVPYEIEVDRVFIHGHPLYGQKRGIALNGRAITVRDSYISDIKALGIDTQAIGGWNGPGPFRIENNYLEASGEVFLLGGADPDIPNLVPEQVVVRLNHMSRPMSWKEPIIPTPGGMQASLSQGGALAAGTHRYRVVARRPVGGGNMGRSTAAEASVTVTSGSAVATITWAPVADATEYRLHVTRPSGAESYWTLAATAYTDAGIDGVRGAAPSGPGDRWQVKNIFELKNARHVLVESNIFENNWMHAQPGYAILFTPRNDEGGCTWCVVEHVTFQYNIVRNSSAGINLSGYDALHPSAQTNHVTIRHNLFYGITRTLGGNGWFMLIGDGPRDIVVDHNTADFDGTAVVYTYGGTQAAPWQIPGFQFTNNAMRHNTYGINGTYFGWGNGILTSYYPGAYVTANWLEGGTASRYPSGNYFTGSFASAFVDPAARDYRPAYGGVLTGRATDGTHIGADVGVVLGGVRNVVRGKTVTQPSRPANLRIVTR